MEPKRVIEARKHQARIKKHAAMRDQRRVQKREIGRIGERALMKPVIIGQPAVRFDPEILFRFKFLVAEKPRQIDRAQFDRAFLFPVAIPPPTAALPAAAHPA